MAERLKLRRAVAVFQSSLVHIPCVVGAFKPVILLPASALTGLSPEQLEAVLAHELAHVRRHDFLVNAFQTVIETLLFYHPAIWWLSRRVRQEREHCCDDLAISVCGDVAGYARMLVSVEGLRGRVPPLKTIAGRIVDDQNRPVAAARFWWVVTDGIPEGVIVNTASDEQGRFSISTPDVPPPRPSAVNDTLWILKDGRQLATVPARNGLIVDGKDPGLVIRLEPATDTSFKVVSPDQKPVAGVEVEPLHFRTHMGYTSSRHKLARS